MAIPVPVPNTEVKHPRADDTPLWGKVGSRRLFFFLDDFPPAGRGGFFLPRAGSGAKAEPRIARCSLSRVLLFFLLFLVKFLEKYKNLVRITNKEIICHELIFIMKNMSV